MLGEEACDEGDFRKSGVDAWTYEAEEVWMGDYLLRTNYEHRGINLGEQLFRD